MGDYNINLLNYNTHPATANFLDELSANNFLPYIIHPTRHTVSSSTIIDNIFSNVVDTRTESGNILTQITNHFPQIMLMRNIISIKPKNISPTIKI